jgi:hypothetical protein
VSGDYTWIRAIRIDAALRLNVEYVST